MPDRITDEFVAEVAEVYRDAKRDGLPPTKTVMSTYDRSRSAVSAWLRRARETGELPETTPGKAKA